MREYILSAPGRTEISGSHTCHQPRVTVLGHIQRGGAPNARDRATAARMGDFAVKALSEGRTNCIIGTRGGDIVETPIEEALETLSFGSAGPVRSI